MKKVVKLIQLILLVILFGQHVPTTVLAVENDLKDKIHQQVSSLYGFPATIDNSLKEKLPVLLKQFEDKNYLVQSPVKLFNFTDLGIREDAYYPVMIDQRLIALIYYNQETNTYRLETEDVVKEIGRYNPGLANQTPLIFLIINQQVIGSHKNGISNFSNPTKSSEENQSLLSNIDMSLLDTTISRNIYDETSIFYRKSETISPESSPVSSTSQATPFSPPASSNQNSRKLTTDTANDQVVAPEMSQNSSLTPKIWSFFSGAMKLSFNQNYKKSLDIAGDKDYYRIDIPASPVGTAYDWYAFYLNSGFDSYGTLYDSTGKEISKNDDGNGNRDFKISIQLSAGTYYLEVRAYNNTATGSYVLRADKITGSDDNYSFETAVDLPLSSDYKAALDFGHATYGGDKDYYRINIPEPPVGAVYDQYDFYLNSNFDSYGTLFDSTGKEISKNDDGNGNRDFKISIQLSAGTYYLEVRGYNNTATGSYVVRVDRITGSDDNYSFETAVDLPLNSDYKAALDFGHATYGGDKDYYRIDIPESPVGSAYDRYTCYLNSGFDSYGTLYDSTGKEISKNDNGNGNRDFKISIQLTPGTYYLEVRAYYNTATGSYIVRIDRIDRITWSDDNYSFETAVDLPLNSDYKAALDFGHATYGGDKDYYRIDIPASPVGTAYDWYAFYLNSGFDSYGTLYDSTGKEISKNDDGNGNRDFKISIQLSAGTYYLEVRGYNPTATGSYVVRADNVTNRQDTLMKRLAPNQTISAAFRDGVTTFKLYDFYVFESTESVIYTEQEILFNASFGSTAQILDEQHKFLLR
ncbi:MULTISPECIES: DVUA0089 family protein [Pseudolactococcus]|uniref:Putative peptidase n=1 Tax=Pseudolactococcus piscium MKFS47 TaxID=297352 RepID=A0A0D6DWK1_9LACT|nr:MULTISPECIES: DVUA0089 family protein [Lactococcus]MCJ1972241.1 hypothetical protein [Lactococcus carnosus]MCJ2001086.1 hypothetical protein [Lactococcus carnosus]CEN28333.1 Putative peptidase [Lactococcus piscium MKFS47]